MSLFSQESNPVSYSCIQSNTERSSYAVETSKMKHSIAYYSIQSIFIHQEYTENVSLM